MTLPAWDPSDHSTFSVNVADLSYVDLGSLSSTYDLEQLVITRLLFDRDNIPPLVLVPRAQHMPAYAVAPATNRGDRVSVASYYVLAVARERSTSTLQAQWIDFADGGRVASTDAQWLERFTPFSGINSAFLFVTRTPSPTLVSISTVVPGVLVVGDFVVTDLGVGATELTASADKLMPPVSPSAGLTLTSDPTATIICVPNGSGDGVIVRTFAGSPSVPANLAFTVSWVA